ncbi:MAG: hypothetical protein JWM58_1305 [Rhizobium sp.]|nr:hypothetical protein [Rhizobium sp.]
MISTFTVLIDANVFFGARLKSLVLFLAQTKMFRARWTEKINNEWVNSIHKEQNVPLEKLERMRMLVNASVPDCLVTGYEPLEKSFELPDPDDRHVLAAAIKTCADVIVTFNLKDFPAEILTPLGMKAQHPDDFLLDLFGISPELFISAAQQDFLHYKAPVFTFDQYIAALKKAGLPNTAKQIEEVQLLICNPDR